MIRRTEIFSTEKNQSIFQVQAEAQQNGLSCLITLQVCRWIWCDRAATWRFWHRYSPLSCPVQSPLNVAQAPLPFATLRASGKTAESKNLRPTFPPHEGIQVNGGETWPGWTSALGVRLSECCKLSIISIGRPQKTGVVLIAVAIHSITWSWSPKTATSNTNHSPISQNLYSQLKPFSSSSYIPFHIQYSYRRETLSSTMSELSTNYPFSTPKPTSKSSTIPPVKRFLPKASSRFLQKDIQKRGWSTHVLKLRY